jgi:branched-chain amino acid transport system ATP-binding protein
MTAMLEVKDVARAFAGLRAVDGASFHVDPGEVVGVIGPNGAGKTTLLNCISGVLHINSGTITFDGRRIDRLGPSRIAAIGISRTMQLAEHFKDFNVLDFVLLGRQRFLPRSIWLAGLNAPSTVRRERREVAVVHSLLDRFDLHESADLQLGELPYGTQRLVDIVRALAAEPRLVLLDEPTSGSSLYERQTMRTHVRRIREDGVTAVVVDHDLGFVSDCCDRLVAMALGQSICAGSPADVLSHPEVIESYLGVPVGSADQP